MSQELNFEDKIEILEEANFNGTTFQICCLKELEGSTNVNMAMQLYFAKQQGLKIRFVRIKLNNTKIKTEAGALYYYNGNIQSETKTGGVTGLIKKSLTGSLTGESAMKPEYFGCGDIYLEPSFKHYLSVELDNNAVIVDKSMFYCCSDTVNVKPIFQKNVSSAALGQEGLFQIELSGSGVVILESNVPASEIQQIWLEPGQELKVDGNFAILRSSNVQFSVTTSDKSLIGSALNGEGFLNTFRTNQKGVIWLAPTAPLYNKLSMGLSLNNKGGNNIG